jgi:hypothetical protein
MKLFERYIRFVNNVTTFMPDEQMTEIKVLYLQKLNNIVCGHIF